MILQRDFQRFQDAAQSRRRRNVRLARTCRAGRVVMCDHKPSGIKIEGAAHGAAQGYLHLSPLATVVEILGDEQPSCGKEQHHHALLAADAQTTHEVTAEFRGAGIERLADQRLTRGCLGETAGRNDRRAHIRTAPLSCRQRVAQRIRGGGPDGAQRAEATDQRAGEGLGVGTGIGGEEARQDE